MENTIKELEQTFFRFGDKFTQIGYNPSTDMYLYRRELSTGPVYYEVFKRKINAYYTVSYPKDAAFGRWAKCCRRLEDAERHYNEGL